MLDRTVLDYCQELSGLGIGNEAYEHPELNKSLEVLNYFQKGISDSMPTLIMKGDGRFLAVVIRGDCKIDFKKVKKALRINDLRFASPEEFIQFTGLPVGAARVYTPGAETLIDLKVLDQEYLMGGSGRFDCTIKYKTSDLTKIPGSRVIDVTTKL